MDNHSLVWFIAWQSVSNAFILFLILFWHRCTFIDSGNNKCGAGQREQSTFEFVGHGVMGIFHPEKLENPKR